MGVDIYIQMHVNVIVNILNEYLVNRVIRSRYECAGMILTVEIYIAFNELWG